MLYVGAQPRVNVLEVRFTQTRRLEVKAAYATEARQAQEDATSWSRVCLLLTSYR